MNSTEKKFLLMFMSLTAVSSIAFANNAVVDKTSSGSSVSTDSSKNDSKTTLIDSGFSYNSSTKVSPNGISTVNLPNYWDRANSLYPLKVDANTHIGVQSTSFSQGFEVQNRNAYAPKFSDKYTSTYANTDTTNIVNKEINLLSNYNYNTATSTSFTTSSFRTTPVVLPKVVESVTNKNSSLVIGSISSIPKSLWKNNLDNSKPASEDNSVYVWNASNKNWATFKTSTKREIPAAVKPFMSVTALTTNTLGTNIPVTSRGVRTASSDSIISAQALETAGLNNLAIGSHVSASSDLQSRSNANTPVVDSIFGVKVSQDNYIPQPAITNGNDSYINIDGSHVVNLSIINTTSLEHPTYHSQVLTKQGSGALVITDTDSNIKKLNYVTGYKVTNGSLYIGVGKDLDQFLDYNKQYLIDTGTILGISTKASKAKSTNFNATVVKSSGKLIVETNADQSLNLKASRFGGKFIEVYSGLVNYDISADPTNPSANLVPLPVFSGNGDVAFSNSMVQDDRLTLNFDSLSQVDKLMGNLVVKDKTTIAFNLNNGNLNTLGLKSKAIDDAIVENINNSNLTFNKLQDFHGKIANNQSSVYNKAGIVLRGTGALNSDLTVNGKHGTVYLDTVSAKPTDTITSCVTLIGDTVTKIGKSTLDLTSGLVSSVNKFNIYEGKLVLSNNSASNSEVNYLIQDDASLEFTGSDSINYRLASIRGGELDVNLDTGKYLNVTAGNIVAVKKLNIKSGIVDLHLSGSGSVRPQFQIYNKDQKVKSTSGILLVANQSSSVEGANHFVANDTVLENYYGNLYTGNNITLDLNLTKDLNPITFISTRVSTSIIRNESTKDLKLTNLGSYFGTVIADKGNVVLDGIKAINTNSKIIAKNGHSVTLNIAKTQNNKIVPGVNDLHIDATILTKTGNGSLSLANAHLTNLTNLNVNGGVLALTSNIDSGSKPIVFNLGTDTDTYLVANAQNLDYSKHSFKGTGNLVLNQQNDKDLLVDLKNLTTTGKVTILGTVKAQLSNTKLNPKFSLFGTGTLHLVSSKGTHQSQNFEITNLSKLFGFNGTLELDDYTNVDFNNIDLSVSNFKLLSNIGNKEVYITNSNTSNLTLNDLSQYHGHLVAKNGNIVVNNANNLNNLTLESATGKHHTFYLNVGSTDKVTDTHNLDAHLVDLVKTGDGTLSLDQAYLRDVNNINVTAGTLQFTSQPFELSTVDIPVNYLVGANSRFGFNTTAKTEQLDLVLNSTVTGAGTVFADLKANDSVTFDLDKLKQTGGLALTNGTVNLQLDNSQARQDLNFNVTGNSNLVIGTDPKLASTTEHTLVVNHLNNLSAYEGNVTLANNTVVEIADQKADVNLNAVKFVSKENDNATIYNLNSNNLTINDLTHFNGKVISDYGNIILSGDKAFNTKAEITVNNGHDILLETKNAVANAYQLSTGLHLVGTSVRKIGAGSLALEQANFKNIEHFNVDNGNLVFTSDANFDKNVNFNLEKDTNLVFQGQGDLDFTRIRTSGNGNIVINQLVGHKVFLNLENLQHTGNLTINQGVVNSYLGKTSNKLNFTLTGKGRLNLNANNNFVGQDSANTLLIDGANTLDNFEGTILVDNNTTLDLNLLNYTVGSQFISQTDSNAKIRNINTSTLTFTDLSSYAGKIYATNGDVTLSGIKALNTKAEINAENSHSVNLQVVEHKNYLVDALTVNSYQINKIGLGTITFNDTHFNNLLTLNLKEGGVVINQNLFSTNLGTYKLSKNTALGLALAKQDNEFYGQVIGTGSVILIRDAKAKSEQFNSNVIVDTNEHNLVLSVRNTNSIPILVGKGNVFTIAGLGSFAHSSSIADGSIGYNDPNKNVIVSHSSVSSLDSISIGANIGSGNFGHSQFDTITDIDEKPTTHSVISGSNSIVPVNDSYSSRSSSATNNDNSVVYSDVANSNYDNTSEVNNSVVDNETVARNNNFIDDSQYRSHAVVSDTTSILDDSASTTVSSNLNLISGSSNQSQVLSNEREIIINHNLDNFNGKLTTEKGINLVVRGTSVPLNMVAGNGKITSDLTGKEALVFDNQQNFTGEVVAEKGDIAVVGNSISTSPTYVVDDSNIILSSSSDDILDLSDYNLRNNSENNYFVSVGNKNVNINDRSARNVKNFVLADGTLNVKDNVQLDKVVNAGNINIGNNNLTMDNYDYQNGNGTLELNVLPQSNPRIQITGASSDVNLKININSNDARLALKNHQVNLVKTSSGAKVSILNLDQLNLGHNYKVVVSSSESNVAIESVVDDKVINLFHLMTAGQIAAVTPYSSLEFSNVVGGRFVASQYTDTNFKNLPNSDLTSYKNSSSVSGYNFHFGKDVVNDKFHYNPIVEFRDLDIITNTTVKNEGKTSSNAELMSTMLHNNFKYGSLVVRTDLGVDSLIYSGYARNYYLHTLNTGANFAYQPEFDLSHGITLALRGCIGGDYHPIIHQTLTKFAPHNLAQIVANNSYRVFVKAGISLSTKYFSFGLDGRFTYNAGSLEILSEHDKVKNELNSKYIWDVNTTTNLFLTNHFSLNLLVNVNNQFRSVNTSTQVGLSYKW